MFLLILTKPSLTFSHFHLFLLWALTDLFLVWDIRNSKPTTACRRPPPADEGGKLFVAKYKKFLDKELSDPEAYPTSKLKRNFSIVLKVMDSIEKTPRVRDMIALSSIENNSPVEKVVFTVDMLTQFLRATTSTPAKAKDAPCVGWAAAGLKLFKDNPLTVVALEHDPAYRDHSPRV